jgi:GT2 family glycosyltransferase
LNETQEKVDISIIIPTVKQVDLVKNCLDALLASNPSSIYSWEVIVVDDGSEPELQQRLRNELQSYPVRLLTKNENSGFAATVNYGATLSDARYICLLNNDVTLVQQGWLDLMMREATRTQVGVVGPRLLYPDGQIQHGGIIYLPQIGCFDHEYRHQPGSYDPALRSREVLGVTGALMLIHRQLWDLLKGMDERFFVGMEDIDFSLRTWEKGWRIIYCGEAYAVHPEGYTRGNDPYWNSKGIESGQRFGQIWQGRLSLLRRVLKSGTTRLSISEEQAALWRRVCTRGTIQRFSSVNPVVSTTQRTYSFRQ